MNRKKIGMMFLSVVCISTIILGCGGSSSTSKTKEPTELTPTNQAETVKKEIPTDAGVVSEDTKVEVKSKDGKASSELTVPAGTAFTDASGKKLETVTPKITVTQDKGEKSEDKEKKIITQTKIEVTDKNGTKIIPTKPIDVKVKAPSGAKPGDEVKVSIPEGADKAPGQKKLVIFIVDENGFISVRIFPEVFKSITVILIIVEKDIPITDNSTN